MEALNPAIEDTSRRFLSAVFLWMFFALGISSACIYVFNTYDYMMRFLFVKGYPTALVYLSLIGPFILSYIIRKGVNSIFYAGLCLLFIIYAVLIGVAFSFIMLFFVNSSTFGIFSASCLAFGLMAVIGLFSKTDLTRARPILTLLLAGLVIVTPLVFLLPDLEMDLWFSYGGVLVFLGLGALHFQDLKDTGTQPGLDDMTKRKLALLGALTLYMDFVNLTIFLFGAFLKRK